MLWFFSTKLHKEIKTIISKHFLYLGLSFLSAIILYAAWGEKTFLIFGVFLFATPLLIAEHYSGFAIFFKYLIGLIFTLTSNLLLSFQVFGDHYPSSGIVLLLLNAIAMSVPWALYVINKARFSLSISLILLILSWLTIEYLSSHLNILSPAFNLGNAVSGRPEYIQWIEYTGVAGISTWILLANCLLFYFTCSIVTRSKLFIWFTAMIFVMAIFLPILISKRILYNLLGQHIEVLIIGTHVPSNNLLLPSFSQVAIEALKNKTAATKVVVFPEGVFGIPLTDADLGDPRFSKMLRNQFNSDSLTIILGSITKKGDEYFNSAIIISPSGFSLYNKEKLIPFAEFTPQYSSFVEKFRVLDYELTAGKNQSVIPGISIGICYEALFGEYVSENCAKSHGGLIVFISSERWTKGGAEDFQKISALRAIENRKYVLRSSTDGVISIINPHGIVVNAVNPTNEISVIAASVIPNNKVTFYMKNGDYIGGISSAILLSLIVAQFLWALKKH